MAPYKSLNAFVLTTLVAATWTAAAQAQPASASSTYTVSQLTPEAALKAAQAALTECRKRGFQVAVAVVDRGGVVQALIRDRLAGPHTPETATGKGWTAVSFRTDTLSFAAETQAGRPSSGIRTLPRVVAIGGGVLIQAAGNTLGAVGVSGAPGGESDDACARAGIACRRSPYRPQYRHVISTYRHAISI